MCGAFYTPQVNMWASHVCFACLLSENLCDMDRVGGDVILQSHVAKIWVKSDRCQQCVTSQRLLTIRRQRISHVIPNNFSLKTRRQFESRLRTAHSRSGYVRWGGGLRD